MLNGNLNEITGTILRDVFPLFYKIENIIRIKIIKYKRRKVCQPLTATPSSLEPF